MKTSLVLCLLFLYALSGLANISEASRELFISVDYACFKYSDNVEIVFTEIYYSLLRSQFFYQPDSTGYYALANMYAELKSETGDLIDSNSWQVAFHVSSLAEAKQSYYLVNDVFTASLMPGNYDLTIGASDVYSNISGKQKIKMVVPASSPDRLDISQIELAYNISEPDGGPFDKAGKKITPNTRKVFSHDDTIAYFYAEIYNLDHSWGNYTIDMLIYDGNGILYKNIPPTTQPISGNSAVILNGFNISAFKVGLYNLQVNVYSGGDSVFTTKEFEVCPGKLEWEIAIEKKELADFPEADRITNENEAKNFRDQILYICTRDELRQYDELSIEGKNNFAKVFWARRDPNMDTPINEFKIEHYERFRYANEAFSTFRSQKGKGNGWKTDMGRVYITYGTPSDEENYPSSLEERPWIKWNYDDIEGGVYFVFIDETGYGNYRLVHSTAKREPKDYNWESRLRPSTIIR